jgi:hypothetical protein
MNLDIGVLAIGSLFWDNNISRETWRKNRLSLKDQFNVKVPIRYGRCSSSRNYTYTMIFSRLCLRKSHGLGIGKAILCQNKITSLDDITKESKYLWAAETNLSKPNNNISSHWGSVALMINPKLKQKSKISLFWKDFYKTYSDFQPDKSKSEKPIIENGLLNIPWPKIINSQQKLSFDLLLSTVNNPSMVSGLPVYPRTKKIAEAWINDSKGYVNYFWKNQEKGIKTYQDDLIINYLKD